MLGVSQTLKMELSEGLHDNMTAATTNPFYGPQNRFNEKDEADTSGTYHKSALAFVAYFLDVEVFLGNSRAIS